MITAKFPKNIKREQIEGKLTKLFCILLSKDVIVVEEEEQCPAPKIGSWVWLTTPDGGAAGLYIDSIGGTSSEIGRLRITSKLMEIINEIDDKTPKPLSIGEARVCPLTASRCAIFQLTPTHQRIGAIYYTEYKDWDLLTSNIPDTTSSTDRSVKIRLSLGELEIPLPEVLRLVRGKTISFDTPSPFKVRLELNGVSLATGDLHLDKERATMVVESNRSRG